MAKKKTDEPIYKSQTCDACALAEWVTNEFKDYEGAPIMLRCPHCEFLIVRGRKACNRFVKKSR